MLAPSNCLLLKAGEFTIVCSTMSLPYQPPTNQGKGLSSSDCIPGTVSVRSFFQLKKLTLNSLGNANTDVMDTIKPKLFSQIGKGLFV